MSLFSFEEMALVFVWFLSLVFNNKFQLGVFIVIWEVSYLIVSTKSCEIEYKIFSFIIAMFFSRMGTMKFFYQKFCFKKPFQIQKYLFSLVPMQWLLTKFLSLSLVSTLLLCPQWLIHSFSKGERQLPK